MLHYDAIQHTQFTRIKAKILGQRNWIEPELYRQIISIYVHMWWFVWLVTIEIESVRSGTKHGWHAMGL